VDHVSWGTVPTERADAARNRRHLLATARDMLAEQGADQLTMDGLAERAGLGKGTVFRRFGTRAGIFRALLDDAERAFQEQVAYGQARVAFLIEHADIARATLDGGQPIPAGSSTPLSQLHIRVLLGQLDLGPADLDMLAVQLTAALDGPLLLYLSAAALTEDPVRVGNRITRGWQDLVRRVARP
jgi:polyketide synthase 12